MYVYIKQALALGYIYLSIMPAETLISIAEKNDWWLRPNTGLNTNLYL